jgi:uncharacterized membrane protein YfcA
MNIELYNILFYILLFAIAFLYASIGHGGASGYLALMVFFSFAPTTMRSTALILNIFVSLTAFIQYYRGGHFSWKLFWPFALASFPAAFIGGLMVIDAKLYKTILGIFLLIAVIRLIGIKFNNQSTYKKQSLAVSLIIGAIIGLFSGMIGIGGGIILSPIILLLHWGNLKQTAAVSALFILVNSISGIAGIITKGIQVSNNMILMILIAFIGGLIGSYIGAQKAGSTLLKTLLAIVLVMASYKLLFT